MTTVIHFVTKLAVSVSTHAFTGGRYIKW